MRTSPQARAHGIAAVIAAVGLCLVIAAPAGATWSIVAVDPRTNEVGGAIASCVDLPARYYGDEGALRNLVLVAGTGAGVTQALLNLDTADRIRADLEAGLSASATIADVSSTTFDGAADQRQHGVVRLDDPAAAAAFTGARAEPWAGDTTGDGVSVQGNILVSEAVVEQALDAFVRRDGDDLVERLVEALRAGSKTGGDSRCDAEQTALFAQVAVVDRDGVLDVRTARVKDGDGRNPVELLAAGELSDPPASPSLAPSWWALAAGLGAGLAIVALLVRRARHGRRERRA
jgi:uncharacterized Ntn-hydrolase superfamily protein